MPLQGLFTASHLPRNRLQSIIYKNCFQKSYHVFPILKLWPLTAQRVVLICPVRCLKGSCWCLNKEQSCQSPEITPGKCMGSPQQPAKCETIIIDFVLCLFKCDFKHTVKLSVKPRYNEAVRVHCQQQDSLEVFSEALKFALDLLSKLDILLPFLRKLICKREEI